MAKGSLLENAILSVLEGSRDLLFVGVALRWATLWEWLCTEARSIRNAHQAVVSSKESL